MIKNRFISLIKRIYPRFGLRDDDVILASFPKSGNTWVRFMWFNIVSQIDLDGKEIDFFTISNSLNANYDGHKYGDTEFYCLPRLVKTHMQYDARFRKNKAIYIWRDPRDALISYYEYMRGEFNRSDLKTLKQFIKSEYGIEKWCIHINSWINNADVIISYKSLKIDTKSVLFNALNELDLGHIDSNVIEEAIYRSRFENMRKIEEIKGRPYPEKRSSESEYKFLRKGKIGEWKERLDIEDQQYISEIVSRHNLDYFLKNK